MKASTSTILLVLLAIAAAAPLASSSTTEADETKVLPLAPWTLLLPLYSRFTGKQDLLASQTRRRILEVVQAEPGTSSNRVARSLGLARNAVEHHVRLLERAGTLRVVRRPKRSFIFGLASTRLPQDFESPLAQRMIDLVGAAGEAGLGRGSVHAELADTPKRTRNHALRSLVSRGILVESPGPAGHTVLRVSHSPQHVSVRVLLDPPVAATQ